MNYDLEQMKLINFLYSTYGVQNLPVQLFIENYLKKSNFCQANAISDLQKPTNISNRYEVNPEQENLEVSVLDIPNSKTDDFFVKFSEVFAKSNSLNEIRLSLEQLRPPIELMIGGSCLSLPVIQARGILLISDIPYNSIEGRVDVFNSDEKKLLNNILQVLNIDFSKTASLSISPWVVFSGVELTREALRSLCILTHRIIELTKPKIVLLFGSKVVMSLLNKSSGISALSGRLCELSNVPETLFIPLIHPRTLLKSPVRKEALWYDLLRIMPKIFGKNSN